ncbi:MAG: hypothetical protein ACFUZC_04975 [Chthoniobacteraceae bacterium]
MAILTLKGDLVPGVASTSDVNAKAPKGVTVTSAFVAVAGKTYYTSGSGIVVTDPTVSSANDIYVVYVISGTAVIGGTTYSASRKAIVRFSTGSAWTTLGDVSTDNVLFQGTNNTAPNQVGQTPGDATLLVKNQGDGLYPVTYWLIQPTDLSAYSTASVSGTSITLPAGTYDLEGYSYATTVSTTGGISGQCSISGGGTITGMISLQRWTPMPSNSTAAPTNFKYWNQLAINCGWTDAPTLSEWCENRGYFKITAPCTITILLSQRTATDASNPAVLKAGSGFRFNKIPGW